MKKWGNSSQKVMTTCRIACSTIAALHLSLSAKFYKKSTNEHFSVFSDSVTVCAALCDPRAASFFG